MTTPNVEELMALADRYATLRIGKGTANTRKELQNALQSQAERIKELERESETYAKAYGLAIVERDNLRHELKTAQEGWRCECSTDDACRFARERDALRAQLDAIAATEPVGKVEIAHDMNDAFMRSLPIGTKLFTRPMPPIIGLQDVHDAITSDPTLAESNAEFDESQFKSVEDLIAHLNKLNSYRDRTLEALSKYKGAK